MRKLYISISWESRQNRCDKVAAVGTKLLLPPVVTFPILNLSSSQIVIIVTIVTITWEL